MKTKNFFSLVTVLAVYSTLASASAAPSATFTDSWKDTAVPDATVVVTTTGSFTFKAKLPLDGEIATTDLDSNSQLMINIGPVGSAEGVFFDTLGDAEKLKLGASGSATFSGVGIFPVPQGTPAQGSLTVTWTPTTLTISGASANDVLAAEGVAVGTFAAGVTNEVDVSLADTNSAFLDLETNVAGTFKNTETADGLGTNAVALEAGSETGAGGGISFSDSWKDSGRTVPLEGAGTSGSFSFKAMLPLAGEITTSDLGSNSQFSFSIGSLGIIANALGQAANLKLGPNGSASFPLAPAGSLSISWTPSTLTVIGAAPGDFLGQEAAFVLNTTGIPADNTIDTVATNEVDISLSDTNGGAFDYDTNVTGTVKNTEKEYPNSANPLFPLETGSLSGSGSGISFSDTWKDTAVPIGYDVSTSGSGSVNISLPLEGLAGITNDNFDIGAIGTNSQFTLSIGSPGSAPIFLDALDAFQKLTRNKNGGAAVYSDPASGTLTLTWTATTLTVSAKAKIDFLGEEQYFETNSDGIPGTRTITGPYEIFLTLTDTNGGMFAYDNPYVPVTGKDAETEKAGASGSWTPLQTGSISGAADFTPPRVTITGPAARSKVYNQNPVIELEGTASDKAGVASIEYYINGQTTNLIEIEPQDLPADSVSWAAPVDFSQFGGPGAFVVSVVATDTYGNKSAPVSRSFQWIQNNSAALAGNYTALYFDTNNGPEPSNAGYITISITGAGSFSGRLYNAASGKSAYGISGQFSESPDGTFAAASLPLMRVSASSYLQVILQVATDSGAGLLTGFVNEFSGPVAAVSSSTAEIQGKLSFYNAGVLPGAYNFYIKPVSNDPSQRPGGFSYGTAIVSNTKGSAGGVALALNLANGGTPSISFSTALAADGSCPVYASFDHGNGVILGWMQFATNGSGAMIPASMAWLTAAGVDAQVISSGNIALAPSTGARSNTSRYGFSPTTNKKSGPIMIIGN